MTLTIADKKAYIEALSEEIFKKPPKQLYWENLNTLILNVAIRYPNELKENERTQLITYIKQLQQTTERKKKRYSWQD